ncbi:ABC transporter permease [Streptomyces lydicus]|uniref:ABC transporter permease n=1 Tax=Streptomyces lydicus TaxID=47763 RepID=UPI00098123EA|nr:ABC transporter permease [Streptomyces lydicus]
MTGFVLLRVRAHRLLLAAALLSVLLTTTVLTTLAAFSGAVGDAGLREALRTRSAAAAALQVKAQLPAGKRESADRAVNQGARRAFDGLPYTVRTLTRSGPYALPRSLRAPDARKGEPDLTHLAALDRSRLTLVRGTWPGHVTRGPLPVALPEAAAARLGAGPGRRITLDNRLSGPAQLTVQVTGVYRPKDRTDPYWKLDDLGGRGVRTLGFTTYGPLLADPAAFRAGPLAQDSVGWLATADFRTLTADRLDALSAAAGPAPKALMADPAFAGRATAGTDLPEALGQLRRALLVNRSTILIVALQLLLLAGCALLLVARMLSTERAGETALLRARGGSRWRIAGLALTESLLLAVPAAVGAPLLSGPLMRLLAGGALARRGLPLDTRLTGPTWLTGVGAALGCALAVAAPALSRTGTDAPGRTEWRSWGRTGADLGLLVIAGVAYWQLQRQTAGGDGTGGAGGVLTGDTTGQLGIDPVLVTAPALALLAGTVLTLRLLPLAARIAERGAARGRGLAAALAGWQISRRPSPSSHLRSGRGGAHRGAGPVLLLVLATALGMLAIGQRASWDRSQDDQADFRAGAAVRVLASRIPQWGQGGAYAAVPGVAAALPVGQAELDLSGGRSSSLLALDTVGASPARTTSGAGGTPAGALLLRGDLVGGAADGTAGAAADGVLRAVAPRGGAPGADGPELPTATREVRLTATLRSLKALRVAPERVQQPTDEAATHETGPVPATLAVLITDGFGVPATLPLGTLPADGRPHTLRVDLAAAAGAPAGRPAGPLRLTGLVVDTDQSDVSHRQRLSVLGAQAVVGHDPPRALTPPSALAWRTQLSDRSSSVGEAYGPRADRAEVPAGGLLSQTYDTGARLDDWGAAVTSLRITVARPTPPPLAAVATDAFLRDSGSKVGAVIDVPVNGQQLKARSVRAVRALPGPADGDAGSGLLVDFRAVNEALAERGAAPLAATEWWLRPEPGAVAKVVGALRSRPDTDPGQVLVRDEIARQLHDDPLGLGPRSALTAAAAVAVALAAVGFAVGAAGSVRERAREFAVLRALGAPRRQLARMIAAEQGVLIALALAVGGALGTVLTRAVVPLVVLTGQAGRPVPPVLVELPAGQVAALLAAVAAVPLLVVAGIGLRRGDPVAALRDQGAL